MKLCYPFSHELLEIPLFLHVQLKNYRKKKQNIRFGKKKFKKKPLFLILFLHSTQINQT